MIKKLLIGNLMSMFLFHFISYQTRIFFRVSVSLNTDLSELMNLH